MKIRTRHGGDIKELCELARLVHEVDGYPVLLPENPADFVVTSNCIDAWVAVSEGDICGHVSLHTVFSDAIAEMASRHFECERSELVAVSRLFVSPQARGLGFGRALLDVAVRDARRRGLALVLDVVTSFGGAIALYERSGWKRIGTASVAMPNDKPIDEYVYVLEST